MSTNEEQPQPQVGQQPTVTTSQQPPTVNTSGTGTPATPEQQQPSTMAIPTATGEPTTAPSVDQNQPPTTATVAGATLNPEQIAEMRCAFCMNSMLQSTKVNTKPVTDKRTPANHPTKGTDGKAVAVFCDDCADKPYADAKTAVVIERNGRIRNIPIHNWDNAVVTNTATTTAAGTGGNTSTNTTNSTVTTTEGINATAVPAPGQPNVSVTSGDGGNTQQTPQ